MNLEPSIHLIFATLTLSPNEAGLSKLLYNHSRTANRHRQSIRKQTFRLCRELKLSIEGVFNLISLISQQASHQLVSQKCCG